MRSASDKLAIAMELRAKYKSIDKGQRELQEKLPNIPKITVDYGVYHFAGQTTGEGVIPTWGEYYNDIMTIFATIENGFCRAACKYRLAILEEKHNLYKILNTDAEESVDRKRRGGGVLANNMKIDNSVRLVTGMTAMELVETMQWHLKNHAFLEEPLFDWGDVSKPDVQNLRTLMASAELDSGEDLTIEGLGLHPLAEAQATHRFDVLDPLRNRAGKPAADLLRAFMTRDTMNGGRFLAAAARTPLSRVEGDAPGGTRARTSQGAEFSIDLMGRTMEEWYQLANWVDEHNLNDATRVMWVIEIPRVKAARGQLNFEFQQTHLDNIFRPLFEATLLPDDGKNHKLAALLSRIGAFSIRSDEDSREVDFSAKALPPGELPWSANPSDLYFGYYVWANLCSLNACRSRQKPPHNNTFQLRAVAGERATQLDSLVYSFLLSDHISQGLLLKDQPVLQFLYGISGIGVAMSPLSNNGADVAYIDNPFPTFFRRGLTVTLSTHNPLHYHHSDDPLIEEYSTASKLYKLSPVDMTEIARNSVIVSSFPKKTKRKWLLGDYPQEGQHLNALECTNVPNCRLDFRDSCWTCERQVIGAARRRRVSAQASGALTPPRLASPVNHGPSSPTNPQLDGDFAGSQSPKKAPRNSLHFSDESVKYTRVLFDGSSDREPTLITCAALLCRALRIRSEYHPGKVQDVTEHMIEGSLAKAFHQQTRNESTFKESAYTYSTVKGVICIHETTKFPRVPEHIRTFDEFRNHMDEIWEITQNGLLKSFSHRRLLLLEHKYRLHVAVNHSLEAGSTEEKASQNRDFYQATKVDTNVRTETGMTARNLLTFIQAKANNNGDDIVSQRDGSAPQTLRQLLEALYINPQSLTVDNLNVQVDATRELETYQYTPEAKDELLLLLLKTDNEMKGRYFAELTKLTFEQFKRDNFTFAEYRLPIYGASSDEWERLSSWFDTHGMACYNNRWMIQIPRIYSYLRKKDRVRNFADYLNNIFRPLWEVSLHPTKHRWGPRLFHFLNHISGFDCVEDESKVDIPLRMATKAPQEWVEDSEPPYGYYLYHVWANIQTLNEFRRSRGYSTFTFRPSCGEDGGIDHLMAGFLTADGVSYGLNLRLDPVLQYLFYLAQLPISVSPLSNNTKMLDYLDNPFPKYFKRGLHVSLSTDGPLRYHHTQEPLIEEYSIASKVWKLSPNDMCEIARNSVQQSGFPSDFKAKVLGEHWFLSSYRGNDAGKTHLSDIRVTYRWEAYHTEMVLLEFLSGENFPKAMRSLIEETSLLGELEQRKLKQTINRQGIIVATHNEADIQKLSQNNKMTHTQLQEIERKVEELHRQNKQLSETLAEVMAKEVSARHQRTGTSPGFSTSADHEDLMQRIHSSGSEDETDEEGSEDDDDSILGAEPAEQPTSAKSGAPFDSTIGPGGGVPKPTPINPQQRSSPPPSGLPPNISPKHRLAGSVPPPLNRDVLKTSPSTAGLGLPPTATALQPAEGSIRGVLDLPKGFHGQHPNPSYVAFASPMKSLTEKRTNSLIETNEAMWTSLLGVPASVAATTVIGRPSIADVDESKKVPSPRILGGPRRSTAEGSDSGSGGRVTASPPFSTPPPGAVEKDSSNPTPVTPQAFAGVGVVTTEHRLSLPQQQHQQRLSTSERLINETNEELELYMMRLQRPPTSGSSEPQPNARQGGSRFSGLQANTLGRMLARPDPDLVANPADLAFREAPKAPPRGAPMVTNLALTGAPKRPSAANK